MRKVDSVSAVILLALSAYVILTARNFPADTHTLGPGFFPTLAAGLLAVFAGWQLIAALLRKRPEEGPARPKNSLLAIIALTALYIALLPRAGFLVMTPLFLVACGLVLNEEVKPRWKTLVLSSLGTTGVLYTVFSILLNVPLP